MFTMVLHLLFFSKQFEDIWASRLWVSGAGNLVPFFAWYRFRAAEEFVVIFDVCFIYWFPTRMSNLDSSVRRTHFHFETIHFKWALAHRTRRRFWTVFTYGFLFGRTQKGDGTANYVYRVYQWFLEVFLGPCCVQWPNHADEWCSVVWGPEDHSLMPTKVFKLFHLRTAISPVSLNLLMLLCTVDDDICKAFAIWCWGMLFLKYSTICFYALFDRLESLCPSLHLRDSVSLRHPF